MFEQALCVKVKKIYGEKTIAITKKIGINNRKLKIRKNVNHVYIPLIRNPDIDELSKLKARLSDFKLVTNSFTKKKPKAKKLDEILENQLPHSLLAILPRALDIIGDIAIIDIPPELRNYKQIIGKAVLKIHRNLETVFAKKGAVRGRYRLRKLELIAGKKKTNTTHKEYGCRYQVDIATAYFSPRLSHEHNRIASIIQKGETVIDLFAGVGPFSVLIAKKNIDTRIYAIDINPKAVQFLEKDIRLNRVDNQVIPILEDARRVIEERLVSVADRVIMNLPEKAMEFVESACKAIKPSGGVIHYYSFLRLPNSMEDAKLCFSNAVKNTGRKVNSFLSAKIVRETAPYECQIVLDAKIL